MKKAKKIIISILICLLAVEGGLLIGEGYVYYKHGYSSLNINGRIVAEIDNLINFSKSAEWHPN